MPLPLERKKVYILSYMFEYPSPSGAEGSEGREIKASVIYSFKEKKNH